MEGECGNGRVMLQRHYYSVDIIGGDMSSGAGAWSGHRVCRTGESGCWDEEMGWEMEEWDGTECGVCTYPAPSARVLRFRLVQHCSAPSTERLRSGHLSWPSGRKSGGGLPAIAGVGVTVLTGVPVECEGSPYQEYSSNSSWPGALGGSGGGSPKK